MYTGPHIIKDGLVFGYDTGFPSVSSNPDTYKYNNGKPTTNLLTQNGASSLDVRTDIYANTTKTNLGGGKYRFVNDGTGGTTIRLYANVNDLVDGTTYGCSVSYQDFNPGDGTAIRLDWCDQNNTTFSLTNFGSANRIFMTGARSTYDNTFRFLDISLPINSSIVLFNAQVELETPSPFTDNTRSVTESLIDLKRTTDIDLSNVSFNSNAQMIFDGTDDRIELGDQFDIADYFIDNQSFTIEAVVNLLNTDTNNNGGIFSNQKFQSQTDAPGFGLCIRRANNTLYYCMNIVEVDNSIQTSYEALAQVAANIGNLEHVTYVYDNNTSTIYAYINGELANSQTNSNFNWSLPTDTTRTKIGTSTQGGWGYYHEMDLPVVKCYNKALTSAEVSQNYNALKSRFNL